MRIVDADVVIAIISSRIIDNVDFESGEYCNNWLVEFENSKYTECIQIIEDNVIDVK